MVQLETEKYLQRGIKFNGLSARTIENYRYARQRVGFGVIDSDHLVEVWEMLLDRVKSKSLSVNLAKTFADLVSGTADLYGLEMPRCIERTELLDILKSKRGIPTSYSDEDIRLILN